MTIRCVLYARTSCQPKGKPSFSLASQLDDEREYVRRLPGAVVVAEIADPAEKGPLLDRPGLNQVRRMAAAGEFDLLLAHDMDRVARKTLLQLTLEEELAECAVQIAYVAASYANDDEGRLQKQVRAAVSEYERAKILERTLRGKRRKAKEGLCPGGGRRPYGYEYDGAGHLVVIPAEAATVQLIFALYGAQCYSLAEVASELNRRQIPTQQRKNVWSRGNLRNILRNETYTGTGYYNKLQTLVPYGKKKRLRERAEWIPYPTPALVARELWQVVQERLDENRERGRKRARAPLLLTGMIRCGPCQRAYSGSSFNGWRNYRDGGGRHKLLGARHVDELVWLAIRELLLEPESLLRGRQELQERQEHQAAESPAARAQLQRQADRLTQRLDALTDLYLDGRAQMNKEEYLRRRQTLLAEQAALATQRQALDQEAVLVITPRHLTAAREFAAQVSARIDLLDEAQRRAVLQRLQLAVTVWPDEQSLEVRGVFPAPVVLSTSSTSVRQQGGLPFAFTIPLVLQLPAVIAE